jgi:hypothetical protein
MSLHFPDFTSAAVAGLAEAAETILADAKDKAPVLTGKLRDSGTYQVDVPEAAIGFTDNKAVAAHENLSDQLKNGKQAKFLELALQENQAALLSALAHHLGGVL